MVNKIFELQKNIKNVHEVLTDAQLSQIVKEYVKDKPWKIVDEEMTPAADGISGFLGDHFKICLHVMVDEGVKKIHLFVKSMPIFNKFKAKFIDEGNFYRREMVMLKLFDEMKYANDANRWCSKAFIFTDTMVVMPDLCYEGYSLHSLTQTLDLRHVLLVAASLARYHASFANYETKMSITRGRNYTILEDYGDIIKEFNFEDSPWMRAAAKLSANVINILSDKYRNTVPNLEETLMKSFIAACDQLRVYEDTLNVVIHKDLWMNNIMFKYENGVPTNALLVDFQCVRYAPPAFDVMIMLNLTTSRAFREKHEKEVFYHYFKVFYDSLDVHTRAKINRLCYDLEDFLKWTEIGRIFGLLEAITISPYVLMDSKTAQETFDDPDTFDKYSNEDRTEPVLAYCEKNSFYKERQVELIEEYVGRYVRKDI